MQRRTIEYLCTLIWCLYTGSAAAHTDQCSELAVGPARGVQCLHCMHPNAKSSTPLIIQALLDSCRKDVAIAFVVDGSFGFDATVINDSISELAAFGRTVHLHLYILNGPAQRRWRDHIFTGLASNIPPDVFRHDIFTDRTLQKSYSRLVKRIAGEIESVLAAGGTVSIVPMLEDNLDDRSFTKLLSLTKRSVKKELPITYARNACSDCYVGNGWTVPRTAVKEDHKVSATFDQRHGFISNDGWGYVYFSEQDRITLSNPVRHPDREEVALPIDDLKPLLWRSSDQNNVFLLWVSLFQDTLPGSDSVKPNKRTFPIPSSTQLSSISTFLASERNQ